MEFNTETEREARLSRAAFDLRDVFEYRLDHALNGYERASIAEVCRETYFAMLDFAE